MSSPHPATIVVPLAPNRDGIIAAAPPIKRWREQVGETAKAVLLQTIPDWKADCCWHLIITARSECVPTPENQ